MTGLIFSALPFLASIVVTRREPAHRPIRDALGVSAWFSLCSWLVGVPRGHEAPLLALWGLVALASGIAYLETFTWNNADALALSATVTVLALNPHHDPSVSWGWRTWGPFVASSVVGALAAWRWQRRRFSPSLLLWHPRIPPPRIAQRTALILLASDVAMLAFIPWPGAQIWQGRAAACAVTVYQLRALVWTRVQPLRIWWYLARTGQWWGCDGADAEDELGPIGAWRLRILGLTLGPSERNRS